MHFRPMLPGDVPRVHHLQTLGFTPEYWEPEELFADRLRAWPSGCHVVAENAAPGASLLAYVVSHPWTHGDVPALGQIPLQLPPVPTSHHLHDVVVAPSAQGRGLAAQLLARVIASVPPVIPRLTLVAVQNSAPFWARHQFVPSGSLSLAHYPSGAVGMERRLEVQG